MKVKFTPSETDIIKHRLDAPDAILDVLTDSGFDAGEVEEALERIVCEIGRAHV